MSKQNWIMNNLPVQDQIIRSKEMIALTEFEKIDTHLSQKSDKFLNELDKQFNSSYGIFKFKTIEDTEVCSGTLVPEAFIAELVNHEKLKALIPELNPFQDKYEFQHNVGGISSLYTLLGDLCSLLIFGGAYSRGTDLIETELISVVKDFIDDFLPDGFKNYDYYVTSEAWNGWFCNVAWDYTYIMINRNRKELNLICITDMD